MTTTVLTVLRIAAAAAFLIVGLLAMGAWISGRERRRGYLALALGCLGLLALGTPIEPLVGHRAIEGSVTIVLLMASAAGLLLYRNSVVRLPRLGAVLATVALVGSTALAFASGLPWTASSASRTSLQQTVADVLIAVWCVCVLEPSYRLFRLAGGLPRVQRARMRSLGIGYAILAGVLLVGVVVAGRVDNTTASIVLEAVALVCVPPFYLSFAPPRMLRRLWRQTEQEDLTRATHDLLLYSPDRKTLARGGLDWAVRLVGGRGGLVADGDSELLALQGMSEPEARELLADRRLRQGSSAPLVGPDGRTAIVEHLPIQSGSGLLVVVSGSLSPAFGSDEAEWLHGYAAALAIALDRVRIAEMAGQTEAELRSARDLAEEANRAKSEFLSRMSHELRTPLTAMIGFAELLLLERLGEVQKRHVQTILKAGDHLLALINDILDIARIEEGRLTMSPEPVRVSSLVREVIELVKPMLTDREVTVTADGVPPELSVIADNQRLKQVLLNLVTNAVKYNRRGGRVDIAASAGHHNARISVADSGPGLGEEELARLFEPFERLSAATSDVEGTGLGLTLSKSLMEAMAGRIGVESTSGKGSTFWVELPLLAGPTADGAHSTDGAASSGDAASKEARLTGVVLYVEDNLSNVRLVEGIVARRPGVRLLAAMQGRIALDLARQHRPDLILMDVHIPDMDGAELLHRFAAEPATASVPVVVISADATPHQAERLLAAGAREYLTKPIRVTTLLAALDRNLGPVPVAAEPEG